MKITPEQRKEVKFHGFLSNNDGEHFSCRVIIENGTLTVEQLENICEVAKEYGNSSVSFTTRLTVEIPGIEFDDIENVKEHLSKVGLKSGGTGARIRPIVSCKGTVCTFSILDTQKLGSELHKEFYDKYYDVKLPHKFKIGIGGCPNNCIKPSLNDFGLIGQIKPQYNEEMCVGCKKCAVEKICKVGAAKVIAGKLYIDKNKCLNCGLCIGNCKFDALEVDKKGLKIMLGGKWGKLSRPGTPIEGIYTVEEAKRILEKAILIYKTQGENGERFGDMIDRIGFDKVQNELLNSEISITGNVNC